MSKMYLMRNKPIRIFFYVFMILILVFANACQDASEIDLQTSTENEQSRSHSNAPIINDNGKINLNGKKAPSFDLVLKAVKTNDFSIELPEGWKYDITPGNLEFGIVAYDPVKPERRIFYFYIFNPFMKSEEARDFFKYYYGGSSIFGSCPVLEPATVSEFYYKWNEYSDFLNLQGYNFDYMRFGELNIIETHELENYMSSYSLDSSVVRAHLTLENSNIPCEGLLSGSVVSLGTYYQNNIDCYPLSVYNVMGIIAPADEFPQLQEKLAGILKSFAFTDSYVSSYLKKSEDATKAILDNARAMQAVYDSYNAAWHERQKSNDTISQKNSDATLGYDRLYDAQTGEIYRAEVGWYDDYNLNRNEYDKPQLHMIENNDDDRYSQGIDYYIYN